MATLLLGGANLPSAQAQTGPDISVSLTARHERLEGLPTNNTVYVQVGVAPTASSERNVDGVTDAYLPIQVDSELETPGAVDVPLDPLERDEVPGMDTLSKRSRRGRGIQTQSENATDVGPWVLTPKFMQDALNSAILAQGVQGALSRLEGLSTRARTSALLPELRFRAGRNADQSLRLAPTADDPYRYSQSGGVAYILEGAATFRLSRLVFANEELGIERLKLAQARERDRVTAVVLEELFAWQDAYQEATYSQTAAGAIRSRRGQARLYQSALRLDVLTGGWFIAHAPKLPAPATEPANAVPGKPDGLAKRPVDALPLAPRLQLIPKLPFPPNDADPSPPAKPRGRQVTTPKGRPGLWAMDSGREPTGIARLAPASTQVLQGTDLESPATSR